MTTHLLYVLLWPPTWKGSKKATRILVRLMNSGPHLNHDGATSGNYCMVACFELSYSEKCLQQRCQDSAGISKLVLIVLSQYQKRATVAWDMVDSMTVGWGQRSLLPWLGWVQYLNLGTVSAPLTCPPSARFSGDLHLAKADDIEDSTYRLVFRRIVSGIKFQFQNIYLRFFPLAYYKYLYGRSSSRS